MNASLWKQPGEDKWAVCAGPGPTDVKGYISGPKDGWVIDNDQLRTRHIDPETAASRILKDTVSGTSEYNIAKDGVGRTVRTTPEVISVLTSQGWVVRVEIKKNP